MSLENKAGLLNDYALKSNEMTEVDSTMNALSATTTGTGYVDYAASNALTVEECEGAGLDSSGLSAD
jgi:hypothetical protein